MVGSRRRRPWPSPAGVATTTWPNSSNATCSRANARSGCSTTRLGVQVPERTHTCVHGLHYVGDKLGALARIASWLGEDGLFVANFDARSVRGADGTPAGRRLTAELRRQGFGYDTARRRIMRRGGGRIRLPYRYLGADDRAGPNYTGQPAVDSFYEPR